MPEAESLVPPESYAMVGELLSEPVTAVISLKESQRYAHAVDDLNPLYFDEAYAKENGYRGLLAPPTFLNYAVVQTRPLTDLRTDGLFRGRGRAVRLRVSRNMFGGESWDFLAPVYVGDTVTAATRLASLEEKQGGSGPFVLTTTETTFTNQDGDVLARSRQNAIAR